MAGACQSGGAPVDIGWGVSCSNERFTAVALDWVGSPVFETPELAVERFVNPVRPDGLAASQKLPGESLPDDGWERADFVPTPEGTMPIASTLPEQLASAALPSTAFVHRDGSRIDGVLVLRAQPGGWVVDDMHVCSS